ncbi:MAG: dihydropteroate synthase [Planctomycetota bacterium]|nr:MAG: dihydropteroate synthase [Planctomycetota bacterium]
MSTTEGGIAPRPLPPRPVAPPASARRWRHARGVLDLSRPVLLGVLNVTPDSFSDGGRYLDPQRALERGRQLVAEGAAVVDVGGESTRPGAQPVPVDEELRRVLPVVERLAADGIVVSIDTRRPEVARRALAAGAAIVNDVAGLRDPRMVELALGSEAGLLVMHMRGEPRTMQRDPHYDDVRAEVHRWLLGRARELEAAGVGGERIALDPGFGFGKRLEHNAQLVCGLADLVAAGYPVAVGFSRKSMLGRLVLPQPREDHVARAPHERLPAGLALTAWAWLCGVRIVRTHDVRTTLDALRALDNALTLGGCVGGGGPN